MKAKCSCGFYATEGYQLFLGAYLFSNSITTDLYNKFKYFPCFTCRRPKSLRFSHHCWVGSLYYILVPWNGHSPMQGRFYNISSQVQGLVWENHITVCHQHSLLSFSTQLPIKLHQKVFVLFLYCRKMRQLSRFILWAWLQIPNK